MRINRYSVTHRLSDWPDCSLELRCRKLHRIANAVVLLDEPQSIPVSLLGPTVDTL